jgi:hypothetical protein
MQPQRAAKEGNNETLRVAEYAGMWLALSKRRIDVLRGNYCGGKSHRVSERSHASLAAQQTDGNCVGEVEVKK